MAIVNKSIVCVLNRKHNVLSLISGAYGCYSNLIGCPNGESTKLNYAPCESNDTAFHKTQNLTPSPGPMDKSDKWKTTIGVIMAPIVIFVTFLLSAYPFGPTNPADFIFLNSKCQELIAMYNLPLYLMKQLYALPFVRFVHRPG